MSLDKFNFTCFNRIFAHFSGTKLKMLDDHKGWVNGVCWDPMDQFITTISSDRILRVYDTTKNYKNVCKTYKAQLPIAAICPDQNKPERFSSYRSFVKTD